MYIGFHQEKKYKGYRFKTSQLSTIVAGISKHSNHLGFKNPSFFCDVLWIPNVAESFSDEILHHGSCNSFTEIKKAVIEVFGEPPPLRWCLHKKSVLLASWSEVIQWPQYKCSFRSSEVEEVFNCRPNLLFKFQSIKAFPQTSCKSLTPCLAELITSGKTPSRSSSRLRRSIPSRKSWETAAEEAKISDFIEVNVSLYVLYDTN